MNVPLSVASYSRYPPEEGEHGQEKRAPLSSLLHLLALRSPGPIDCIAFQNPLSRFADLVSGSQLELTGLLPDLTHF